ncbi:CPBP family intramembrane glutamic endopeptidase [Staphylococcus hominis]|uniref:CPBP family intramembrane glutamic endopeptidase n=1 Tax=Staphylococcus hominis TaxID=1290 RepID=UPI002878DF5A|nr:type II CAAX endopeptidase family protein [Staphylococcus hominis]MDS3838000.1 type II CAAX endopeptidase family protein [Staphylococcus hominis]
MEEGNFIVKNILNRFKNIILVIISGIVLIELFMQLKFIADISKNLFINVAIILIVISIYGMFMKWVKSKDIINKKFFSSKKFSWKSNVSIIMLLYIFEISLSNYFPNHSENQNRIEEKESDMDLLTNIISVSVSPAVIEEICFRGIIYVIIFISSSLLINLNRNYKYIAITMFLIFSSVLFGFLHVAISYDFQNVGAYLVSGITFSIAYILTRDIKVSIVIHALGNLFGVLYRNDMQYISYLIIFVLLTVTLFCIKKIINVVGGYGNYIEYKIKKARAKKILKKDAEKRSVLQ